MNQKSAAAANVGRAGEEIAAKYLTRNGYQILAKNLRLSHKEIDLVAQKAGEIILVEVKTARFDSPVLPEEQLSSAKIRQLKQALVLYCREYRQPPTIVRCDLLAISINQTAKMAKVKHFKNIF